MTDSLIRPEREHAINGVPGRLFALHRPPEPWKPGTFGNQTWISERRPVSGYGRGATLQVEMRFDDNCRNGYNNFAITAEVRVPGQRDVAARGCLHEDIAKVFPELAPLIKWHLMSTEGPMHYPANVIYLAGDRDHWGLRKGEASKDPKHTETRIRFGNSPISHKLAKNFAAWLRLKPNTFRIVPVEYKNDSAALSYKFGPKYTFSGLLPCAWHECLFDSWREAEEWQKALASGDYEFLTFPTLFGEGKARELDKARNAAIWPEATDEELCAEPAELRAKLEARIPAMLAAFRRDMESAGFAWSSVEGE